MKLNELWEKNKTFVLVLLIIVGAYLVISPVRQLQNSQSAYGAGDSNSGQRYASASKSIGSMPTRQDNSQYYPEEQRKIEKTTYLNLEVEQSDYDSAVQSINEIMDQYKGYFVSKNEQKNTYGDREYRTYSITMKVPVKDLENTVQELRYVAELKSLNIDANDMTTQYNDIKAYLDNYKKEKETLLNLYSKALQIDDIIKIQERLSQVQSQIDSYEMQLKNIERVTDYSTIYLTMYEKRDVIENYYEMTGIGQLWSNIVMSFDSVFVFISQIIGFVVVFGVVYLGYKGVKRIIKK